MTLFKFIAEKVGPDVANIILDYKEDLEHAENFKNNVLSKIPTMIRTKLNLDGVHLPIRGKGYFLELNVFRDLLYEFELDHVALNLSEGTGVWGFNVMNGIVFLLKYKKKIPNPDYPSFQQSLDRFYLENRIYTAFEKTSGEYVVRSRSIEFSPPFNPNVIMKAFKYKNL